MPARKRSPKPTLTGAIVLLVLASCGVLGGAVFWAGNSLDAKARSLSANLQAAEHAGLYTSLAQIERAVEADRDARPHLDRAYALWQALPPERQGAIGRLSRLALSRRGTGSILQDLRDELETLPEIQEALMQAAERPECSIPKAEKWGDKDQAPFWNFVREGVRWFAATAVRHGDLGDLFEAEKSLLRAAGLMRHLTAQPSYTTSLRRLGAELEIQRALARVARVNGHRHELVSRLLQRQLERLGPALGPREILKGELAQALASISDPSKNGLEGVPAGDFLAEVGKSGVAELWARYYRQFPEDPEDLTRAQRVLTAMDREADETPFYGNYAGGYHRIVPLLRDVLARRRLALCAAKVLEARAEGHEVEDLTRLGRDAIDPHSEEPLVYRKTPRGTVLYSVGRDGVDDGGRDRPTGPSTRPRYDIVFRLP